MKTSALAFVALMTTALLLTSTSAAAEASLNASITGYQCSASFAGVVQGVPCSGNFVTGLGARAGDYVQIVAAVQYAYHDDGLAIPQPDPLLPVEYERGVLSANPFFVFTPRGCTSGKPCIFPSVSTFASAPLVIGLNATPDDIIGETTFVARYNLNFVSSEPFAAGADFVVRISDVSTQAISAPVPEPASYALLLAGLLLLGTVARRHPRRQASAAAG